MQVATPIKATRLVAGFVAVALVAAVALATPARAVTETETRRLEGANRYATAAAVATDTFPDGAGTVLVATGESFADALAASGIAGALQAPLLLTQTNTLTPVTADTLEELGATDVILIGGTAAISQGVEDTLEVDYDVSRIEGTNRFETANAAADAVAGTTAGTPLNPSGGIGETDNGLTAILANGFAFPDAVSASPVAFAGSFPVLLTQTDSLPEATIAAIEDNGIEHVVIVGGTAAVSAAVEAALQDDVEVTTARLAGVNRFATNIAVAQFGRDNLDFSATTVYVATGAAFPDALAAGPGAGTAGNPLLLTQPDAVPAALRAFLQDNAGTVDAVVAIGGTAAIDAETLSDIADLAQLSDNQAFDVEPAADESREVSSSPANSDGARTYTVAGLTAGTAYDLALLDPDVRFTQDGTTRFSDFTLSDDGTSSIESVNGQPSLNTAGSGMERVTATGTATAEGTLTFTVDATETDQVLPVVWFDQTDDGELTLVGDLPDEPFGIGGVTTWVPTEAANTTAGSPRSVTVQTVDPASNLFVANTTASPGATYYYGSGDVLRFGATAPGAALTLSQFEGMLTPGDTLSVEYFQDSQSLFRVTSDTMSDIADVTAASTGVVSAGDSRDRVTVSFTPSNQPDAVYDVYLDANRNGTFQSGTDVLRVGKATSSSITFTEPSSTTARYVVVPSGGTSGQVDSPPTNASTQFSTAEIRTGLGFRLLDQGATVVTNAGLSTANANDVIALRFSKTVQVANGASFTVSGFGAITNGGNSTWTTDGSSVLVTLGTPLNAAGLTYPLTITGVQGVRDGGGTAYNFGAQAGVDNQVEDDGPELMGASSSTCNVGDTSCRLVFNEPVDEPTAEFTGSYGTANGPGVAQVTLGDDDRTITVTFNGAVAAGSTITPAGFNAGAGPGVEDLDGDESAQAAFVYALAG